MRYILTNAQILKDGSFCRVNLLIDHGNVVSISNALPEAPGSVQIDCQNFVIFPGLIDVHVHLREPGFFYKESIETGTLAAATVSLTGGADATADAEDYDAWRLYGRMPHAKP